MWPRRDIAWPGTTVVLTERTRKIASATPRSATNLGPSPMPRMGPKQQTHTRHAPSGPTSVHTPSAGNLGFHQLAALERKPSDFGGTLIPTPSLSHKRCMGRRAGLSFLYKADGCSDTEISCSRHTALDGCWTKSVGDAAGGTCTAAFAPSPCRDIVPVVCCDRLPL